MLGRTYTVVFGAVSVAAAQDFFELTPAANKPIEIVGITIDQTGTADVGDANEELLRVQIIRGFTTSGSGGTAPTPAALNSSVTAAAGFAAEVNNTTVATTGTTVTLYEGAFNVRTGLLLWFPEGLEPGCTATNTRIVVRTTAPADAITLSGTIFVRELA